MGTHHTGLLDPLLVAGDEGDQLAQGGLAGRGQAEELGVAEILDSSHQSDGCNTEVSL